MSNASRTTTQDDKASHLCRYEMRQEVNRSWTVYDTYSSGPEIALAWSVGNLSNREARICCAIVNEKHDARQKHPLKARPPFNHRLQKIDALPLVSEGVAHAHGDQG